jgi:uracil-DNA glycosylase
MRQAPLKASLGDDAPFAPVHFAFGGIRMGAMQSSSEPNPLVLLLDWYRAMGVDCATGDAAINWLQRGGQGPGHDFDFPRRSAPEIAAPTARQVASEGSRPSPAPVPHRPVPHRPAAPAAEARRFPTAAPDAAETAARTLAQAAKSLADLDASLRGFDGCGLKATAKNLCFYRGSEKARVMIIGEAPGRDEDLEGKPFVGRAGRLLDKMLAAIGASEDAVHITNIVYWRPPGNRTPTPQEAQICRPFLERQIELVEPEIIVLLGGAAAKQILDVTEGIMRLRGKWRALEIGNRKVRALATLHPAYLLRTPAAKRLAWRDLLTIAAALKDPVSA